MKSIISVFKSTENDEIEYYTPFFAEWGYTAKFTDEYNNLGYYKWCNLEDPYSDSHCSYWLVNKDNELIHKQVFGILVYEINKNKPSPVTTTRARSVISWLVSPPTTDQFSPIPDKQYMAIKHRNDGKVEVIDLGYLLPISITNLNDHTNEYIAENDVDEKIHQITYYFFTQKQYGKASYESLNSTFSGNEKQESGIYGSVYRISKKDIIDKKYHLFTNADLLLTTPHISAGASIVPGIPESRSNGGKNRVRKSRRKRRERRKTRRRRR